MKTIDETIKDYLRRNRSQGLGGASRFSDTPGVEDFYHFLMDDLKGESLERMLEHLKNHPDDQKLIASARLLLEGHEEAEKTFVPAPLLEKAKGLMPAGRLAQCPHCGKPITPFNKPLSKQKRSNGVWFVLAVGAFLLSFAYPRFFLQWLCLAVLSGFKWIMDQRATRSQILIYKALQQEGEEEKVLARH